MRTSTKAPRERAGADDAENVLKLTTEEDHGDDDGDGDNSNDECVLDQALAFVVTEECKHR